MPKQPSGEIVIRTIAMPANTNVNGDIFGGWLVAQMDIGGAVLAKQISKKRVVTVAIDKMVFLHPVKVGDIVTCYASLTEVGNTSMKISVEAWTHDINSLVKVTEATFTFVAVNAQGKPVPVYSESC